MNTEELKNTNRRYYTLLRKKELEKLNDAAETLLELLDDIKIYDKPQEKIPRGVVNNRSDARFLLEDFDDNLIEIRDSIDIVREGLKWSL